MSKGIPKTHLKVFHGKLSYWKAPSPSHIHIAVVCCFEECREISILEASVIREHILGQNCLENATTIPKWYQDLTSSCRCCHGQPYSCGLWPNYLSNSPASAATAALELVIEIVWGFGAEKIQW